MDCSLNAKNWLSTSRFFEPYIPSSHQNVTEALKLLCQLGEITRSSFQTSGHQTGAQPAEPNVPATPEAKTQPASKATPAPTASQLRDAALIEALIQLNQKRPSFNRGSQSPSIILRPKKSNTL